LRARTRSKQPIPNDDRASADRRRSAENPNVTIVFAPSRLTSVAVGVAVALAGCSSLDSVMHGGKVDYRSESKKTSNLDVPPDLTQLSGRGRFAPANAGTVTASEQQAAGGAAAQAQPAIPVAASSVGNMRIERDGQEHWLVTAESPETLWPKLREFWSETGFTLPVDQPEVGVMETDWAENRADLPQDVIRNTLGRVLDSLYSTGERDQFRTRVERTPTGSEIYIAHRGLQEELVGPTKDRTMWEWRPSDPGLESEMLRRLMIKLGAQPEQAQAAVVASNAPQAAVPDKARLAGEGATSLVVDDTFDQAWRRVGLALDRGSFTVEDRDRSQGVYYVRFVDADELAKDQPGFFSKLFGKDDKQRDALGRYRIKVSQLASGTQAEVAVLNSEGVADDDSNAKKIAKLLVDQLRR